jgi:hypothetical protein
MEEPGPLVDMVILVAGIALILITSVRVSRRRARGKIVTGSTGALLGVTVWLTVLGAVIYLIFR